MKHKITDVQVSSVGPLKEIEKVSESITILLTNRYYSIIQSNLDAVEVYYSYIVLSTSA